MNKFGFIAVAACTVFLLSSASMSAQGRRGRVLSDNTASAKQSHLLDSVVSKYITKDYGAEEGSDDDGEDWGELPANELYHGAWSTTGVNANRQPLRKVPDSITINCRGFVLPTHGGRTSCFGPRGPKRYHYGIDLRVHMGEPIGAAFSGKVRVTRYDAGGYGNYIVIRHNNGLETVYGHLSEIKVFEGQTVVAGQCIGLGGNTGRSTGPHLHFEMRLLGNPINPEKIIDFFGTNKPYNDNYFMVKNNAFDYAKGRVDRFDHVSARTTRRSSVAMLAKNESENKETDTKDLESKDDEQQTTTTSSEDESTSPFYKVANGDNLSTIADKYGMTVSKLCKLNNLRSRSTLRVGQRLKYE